MKSFRSIFLMFVTALLVLSCTEDMDNEYSNKVTDRVMLKFHAAKETKAVCTRSAPDNVDDGVSAGYQVKDFVVFQFDQNGNRIVDPQCYDYTPESGTGGQTIPVVLPPTEGVEYTVVVLANMHNPLANVFFAGATTLDKLMQKYQKFESEPDSYRGNETDGYDLLMNGYTTITRSTQQLDVTLFRNVAKFTLTINNTTGSGITLKSAQVKSVPTKIDYFYHLIEEKNPDALTVPYPKRTSFTTFDYDSDIFSVAPGEKKTLTYYLPAHLMGTSASTSEKQKGLLAPDYATFVELYGVTTDESKFMCYRFYLGENLVDDYNIRPNYHYTLPLTFNTVGNPATDARVEEMPAVMVEQEANSYILNPLTADMQRMYQIPVANRVNTFWVNEQYAGHIPTSTSYTITDDEWSAEVIWQTSGQQMIEFYDENGNRTDKEGRESPVYKGNKTLNIKPKRGAKGNVVVGVYRTDKTGTREYLWSWHLWITDYNPDECRNQNWDGRFKYALSNGSGEVHRYIGAAWDADDAKYHNKWMMDRNLGAMVGEGSFDDMEGLYYTWGRKDPFTAGGNSEKSIYTYNRTTDQFPKFKHPEVARGVHSTIPYYINHPAERFGSDGSLYYANPYEQSIWNDPDWSISAQGGKTKKSFFDPCPPGWRLPESDTWNGVLGHVLNTELGFKIYYDGIDNGENYTIYRWGWLHRGVSYYVSNMYLHSSTPTGAGESGCVLVGGRGSNSPKITSVVRSYGGFARAVQE